MADRKRERPPGTASIKEIWEKTIITFQQRTGQTLNGASQGPDDLRRLLDAHYAAQAETEDVSTAREVGFQIIHAIQLLGGIASQGASMVFAPAGLCFNALSFLLDIPKKVQMFHGEIDAIFLEVGPALARFRIYERMEDTAQIDESLRQFTDQVMMSFVNLCATCINIHREGRWKSFKRSAKRILLDDGSVQAELAHLKKLTQDQLNLQATLTLEVATETGQHARAIKNDVSGLVEAEHKRKLDDERKKVLATIRAKLGLRDDEVAALLETRDMMWKGSLKYSGKWLNNVDVYRDWVDGGRAGSGSSLLGLTGEPGTGKSVLVSSIAHEIRSSNTAATAERSLVGYYHFSLAERRDGEGNKRRLEAVIKSICVQLAEQDLVYARRVSRALNESAGGERHIRDASSTELWATLGVGVPSKKTTHYILLDGVDTLSSEDHEWILRVIPQGDEGTSPRVRVLLSGAPETFQGVHFLSSRMKTVDITRYNEVDIKGFIVEELERMGVFPRTDPDSRRRRRLVEERVLARSNHSYTMIQQDIRQVQAIIASGGSEEDLNRMLRESSTDLQELVRSDLQRIEGMLQPHEIREINEILIWVVAAGSIITLEELAAALFLRFGTVSLQPLEEKITGKYSKIFTLTSSMGRRSPALRDHVEGCVVAQRDRPRQSVDDPKITATISITNGDVQTVRRFFWDLNQHSFLNGFMFDQMSEQSNAVQQKIQVNRTDAHLEIIKRTFDFFLNPQVDERGKALGKYLMRNLSYHLKALSEVAGLDELLPADKHFIGSHVYGMFTNGHFIERNWEYFRWASGWYCNTSHLDICWRWLEDPVAIATLGPRDKEWLADLNKDEDRHFRLLTPVITMIARKWLQESEWDAFNAYRWIEVSLALGTKSEQSSKVRISIDRNDTRLEKVAKAVQWCRQALGATELDHTWYIRLGDTYFAYGEQEAAGKCYEKAVEILHAQELLDKEQLRDVFKSLGESTADPEAAMRYWEEAFKLDEDDMDILYARLQLYVANKREDEGRSIIAKALTKKAPGTDSVMAMAMLETAVSRQDENHMVSMFKAFFSSIIPRLSDFQRRLQQAIETATEADKKQDLATLLLLQGSTMYYLGRDSPGIFGGAAGPLQSCLDVIQDWDKGPSAEKDHDRLDFIKESAVVRLSMVYLGTAMESDDQEHSQVAAEGLRQIYEGNPTAPVAKSALASWYAFKGQRCKAQDLFRADMVEAFNILVDDDAHNDGDGFTMLRTLLCHTGDYQNARRAALLYPRMQFDGIILKELLADEEPSITADLLTQYDNRQPDPRTRPEDRPWNDLQYVWREASRLASEAEQVDDTQRATRYHNVEQILAKHERGVWWGVSCTNCDRPWDTEHGLHACKYCYNVDLCDACWGTLQLGETWRTCVCNSAHDWYRLPPWTTEQYLRACREMVLMESDDGGWKVGSVSEWLGTLCEEWGLDKAGWGFE